MKKIIFKTDKKQKYSYRLGSQFQGWIMENLPTEIVEVLHHSEMNNYAISVTADKDNFYFEINLLNNQAEQVFAEFISKSFEKITLNSASQKDFMILEKQVIELKESQLNRMFYEDSDIFEIELNFKTPTSFKLEDQYYYYPEKQFIFSNLMRKYTQCFEGNLSIDNELLVQVINNVNVVEFNIRSSYYPVHRYYVEGFTGRIKLRFKGNQTLTNYALMLLEFGSYAGVGIKTGMGMGNYVIEAKNRRMHNGR